MLLVTWLNPRFKFNRKPSNFPNMQFVTGARNDIEIASWTSLKFKIRKGRIQTI
jgi:hypothetical protein